MNNVFNLYIIMAESIVRTSNTPRESQLSRDFTNFVSSYSPSGRRNVKNYVW